MRYRLLGIVMAFASCLCFSSTALAYYDDVVKKILDARLEGYPNDMTLNTGDNNPLVWMLLFVLAVVCLLGLFKNAKRSHLD